MTPFDYRSATGTMSLLTAVFTPFDDDGELALDRIDAYADRLLRWGCPAVFVAGTAGEGASLTVPERCAVVERWCEVAAGRLDVHVHVGHTSLADARTLAAHAERAGARAISSVAPYFYRPQTVDALADYCGRIAAAAPSLPFTYYHIPSMTGVRLPASELLEVAGARIPSFAGVKFADVDLVELQRCLHVAGEEHTVFVGAAKIILSALGLGARVAIGSVYNFAAPLYLRMLDHAARGEPEQARECQYLAQQVIATAARFGGELAGFKAMTNVTGIDCGPARPPILSPGSRDRARLRDEVAGLGFFDEVEATHGA